MTMTSQRVRVQVVGEDHEWWTVDHVSPSGYVRLSRPNSVRERVTGSPDYMREAGLTDGHFRAVFGDELADQIKSAHALWTPDAA